MADINVDPTTLRLGNYPPNRIDFMSRLIKCATPPKTSDAFKSSVRGSKPQLCEMLLSQIEDPPKYDLRIVRTPEELENALGRQFNLIFAPSSAGLAHHHDWTIREQINTLGSQSTGYVNQPMRQSKNGDSEVHPVAFNQLELCFSDPDSLGPEYRSSNFLDMANRSGYTFVPIAVSKFCLLTQIAKLTRSGSWDRESAQAEERQDWMIVTHGPIDSPFHTDMSGACTVIVGLTGRNTKSGRDEKIWYVPKGDIATNESLFHSHGTNYTGYPAGVSGIAIGPGDCL